MRFAQNCSSCTPALHLETCGHHQEAYPPIVATHQSQANLVWKDLTAKDVLMEPHAAIKTKYFHCMHKAWLSTNIK